MKTRHTRKSSGFTLIELLTVIAIIGILAGMLLPAIGAVQGKAKKAQCQKDVMELEQAINAYQADYSRLPVSPETRNAHAKAIDSIPDLRFGSTGAPRVPANAFQTPFLNIAPITINPNNSEVVAILMNTTNVLSTTAPGVVINQGFSANPKHQAYLNPKLLNGPGPGGVDVSLSGGYASGIYRDPWGNPYYLVLDMDYDNRVLSPFLDFPKGSAVGQPKYVNKSALVFSAGPDGKFDLNKPVTDKASGNADNVYSW